MTGKTILTWDSKNNAIHHRLTDSIIINERIRKASKDDLPGMTNVDFECNSVVINRLRLGKKELRDALNKRFEEHNKEFYVFEADNEILGYCILKPEFHGYKNCELSWIAVKKKYQNKGIGKRLIEFIEAIARKEGFRNIYAYTSEKENDKVKGFYSNMGYRKINAYEDYYSDGTRAVLFGKKISKH